jgi:hypothetical protein
LRTASPGNAGSEGFRVDILDSSDQVIATLSFYPTTTGYTTCSVPVSFPTAGSYTVRMTELGPNDSLGAIVDNLSMLVCFTAETLIDTADGPQAVQSLRPGDLIWTKDAGLLPLRWIGQRWVEMQALLAEPALRPVVFAPGSLGNALPGRPLAVSPQHRLCRGDWRKELYFGQPKVPVPAQALINGMTVCQPVPHSAVTSVHFLLDVHQIVRSNGVLSESFFPSALSLTELDRAAQAEVSRLFPDLGGLSRAYPRNARSGLRTIEARLVA